MGEQESPMMCLIHGPGHIGQPCPDRAIETVADPKEEYESYENLFLYERLDEHYDEVRGQLDEIKTLIEKYIEVNKQYKEDLGMGVYVDEYALKIETAFRHFTINNKKIDLGVLSNSIDFKDKYNDIVYAVNDYAAFNMLGEKKVSPLEYIS